MQTSLATIGRHGLLLHVSSFILCTLKEALQWLHSWLGNSWANIPTMLALGLSHKWTAELPAQLLPAQPQLHQLSSWPRGGSPARFSTTRIIASSIFLRAFLAAAGSGAPSRPASAEERDTSGASGPLASLKMAPVGYDDLI